MNIANTKKENNIAEYIIYMFQTEDLIRSYELDIKRIKKNLISLIPGDEVEKEGLRIWYSKIISSMKKEQIAMNGHLKEVQDIIIELQLIFNTLKNDDKTFKELTISAQPFFDKNKADNNEVTICLNGMYAYLILKTDDIPVPELTTRSAELFGEVLSYLSYKYKQKHFAGDTK
ncbi:MAG: DUF4924 family protein [Cyclobacteriaceae bacterium]|nr:DUF4924 family protein [Cyclobacteriaceae bacterium]